MAPRLLMCVAPLLLLAHAATVVSSGMTAPNDRTITQVVTLLQNMMKESQTDGNSERELYAKYKCYKDTNEAEKNTEIENLNKLIGLLENKIEELLSSTGTLSKELAALKRRILALEEALEEARVLRVQEAGEYNLKEADLDGAITSMREAIQELSEVGADQTLEAARDHTQYMSDYDSMNRSKYSLGSLDSVVRKALVAASALAGSKQTTAIESFLQTAPFTGTYTAQSGEVVGILKDMRATFKANLAAATSAEGHAIQAYLKYKADVEAELGEMGGDQTKIENTLATNDNSLATKRQELTSAKSDLSNAQTFLSSLLDMYDDKTKQYNKRLELRSQEERALAEAIAILNSDSAFASFGKVDATRTGNVAFVQYQSIRKHAGLLPAMGGSRRKAQAFLQRAADSQHSPLLGRIAALLQTQNPFKVVLKEIDAMLVLIGEEETADDDQKQWCDQERGDTDISIQQKSDALGVLDGDIHSLQQSITDPATGLLFQQSETESSIEENHNNQVSSTAQRRAENAAYRNDIANLVDATALLQRAIVVLRKYYSQISSEVSSSLMQRSPTEPAPPSTWDDEYSGQRESGKSAVDMLEFILQNTQQEETVAHDDEVAAQNGFEREMTAFKLSMGNLQRSLGEIMEQLAKAEKDLNTKQTEHKMTTKEKAALENYLAKIKPGCDFITSSIETRKANRLAETTALNRAKTFLEESPAFTEAEAKAHQESLGECQAVCSLGEDHVDCKACLAKVSSPGYCAGHPEAAGCSPSQ